MEYIRYKKYLKHLDYFSLNIIYENSIILREVYIQLNYYLQVKRIDKEIEVIKEILIEKRG